MTDYAITLTKRKAQKIRIDPEKCDLYEGSAANNTWHVKFWVNKGQTAAANNDTITITLG